MVNGCFSSALQSTGLDGKYQAAKLHGALQTYSSQLVLVQQRFRTEGITSERRPGSCVKQLQQTLKARHEMNAAHMWDMLCSLSRINFGLSCHASAHNEMTTPGSLKRCMSLNQLRTVGVLQGTLALGAHYSVMLPDIHPATSSCLATATTRSTEGSAVSNLATRTRMRTAHAPGPGFCANREFANHEVNPKPRNAQISIPCFPCPNTLCMQSQPQARLACPG